jgi:hypothetical protein
MGPKTAVMRDGDGGGGDGAFRQRTPDLQRPSKATQLQESFS